MRRFLSSKEGPYQAALSSLYTSCAFVAIFGLYPSRGACFRLPEGLCSPAGGLSRLPGAFRRPKASAQSLRLRRARPPRPRFNLIEGPGAAKKRVNESIVESACFFQFGARALAPWKAPVFPSPRKRSEDPRRLLAGYFHLTLGFLQMKDF